ncbi:glycoprotease family protein [Sphingomonas sp. S17]|uniref:DNA, contig: SP658 n=2 Tax=Sphingomonas paucimobilis TaxID=13689 RepID=A0A0C9NGV9_SPHPI|nr:MULTISPECIES: tRNA (adenosine(37)-N6)-threonylcarbamoyltransferase complex dimerization subunit type 1 TsaB [Sphingomonas]EGI53335.1 glycoprotease family protein [Sphingomonas sp. S17]MCM3679948.1 tRNA (adenosine(37)-N6)-threonylcarbamoyltransferase complex dimerization subunit type 1 TsaB [Sphingomonas paucimobilis]MDG5970657.1 tRNA (adenosine(37)-N6)-threonylcarbamoyltransferase complex dimerization subunit type 1 TsaB [Sphingomonas paucimobilis]BCI72263.1 tRNA (adenosine(37)-N6)-threonylc
MRTLVIDTATAACSVALLDGDRVIARAHDVVGRGHAEKLVPMIADLPDGGRAERILVDCGPGSFTGIRVGIAAARGLAFGWGIGASGYSSLALVAAAAFATRDVDAVSVVLEGGHGEVFVQAFARDLTPLSAFASMKPEAALATLEGRVAVGNGVRWLSAIAPDLPVVEALPNAAEAWRLPPALTDMAPRPVYGRAPDAKLPGGITPPEATAA